MINNWKQHDLYMDFSSYTNTNNHPSDIDMIYIGKDNILILGEIKNGMGEYRPGQKWIYEHLAKHWAYDVLILYITHDKRVEKGDKFVDVSQCFVEEYYYKGHWGKPISPVKVIDVLKKYNRKEKEK